ncbi:hypothetical protein ATO7_06290 [Oceanococcus atlanticus]|uniref:Uncharacterized protein n=1 Tax=Oceanococcus atlanticus TaxID=1317117 RepID=A0A1Y1SIJ4_9GAMM|nr:hypothetical protein [Oceanococcus atlanticus]ORE89467.1 hypothetical protein ATO7_06290 [Oceanococcus atlanticus]
MRIIAIAIALSFGWSSAWGGSGSPVELSGGKLTLSQISNANGTEYEIDVKPGDEIELTIIDTCKNDVYIKYLGYTPPPGAGQQKDQGALAAPPCTGEQITAKWIHAAKNAGYVVNVTRKDSTKALQVIQAGGKATPLEDRTYILRVPANVGWGLSFSGGFTISELINRKYSVNTTTMSVEGQEDMQVFTVQRNGNAEDAISPGAGFFAHVSHPQFRFDALDMDFALTFGIGVGQGEETTRMAGVSLGFGEFKITLGEMFGKVTTLPNGYQVGDELPAANAIDTLDTRNDHAFFIAFSYDFLGSSARQEFSGKLAPPEQK